MGNRFGRNQKRRMRAELENWQEAWRRECQLAAWLREKGRRDAETVDRVASVLGKHFAALEPTSINVQYLLPYLRLPLVREPLNDDSAFGGSRCNEPVRMALKELKLNWVTLRADALTGQQFVRVETPAGDIGYAMSTGMVISMNAYRLAENVADAMTPYLAEQFRKQGIP